MKIQSNIYWDSITEKYIVLTEFYGSKDFWAEDSILNFALPSSGIINVEFRDKLILHEW